MIEQEKYFYVVSFTARNQAGVAIIIATSEAVAFSVLQQGGLYNGTPDDYKLVRACNVGKYCGKFYGLALESYTNALVAYDALVSVAGKIVGPQGPQGVPGPQGPVGPMCDLRVGTVTELPIGSSPTVNIVDKGEYYQVNFGIPKYDISPESLAALKAEMKLYIDYNFSQITAELDSWKNNLEEELDEWKGDVDSSINEMLEDIEDFKSTVTDWMEDNERVLANALVRHERQLEG